MNDYKIKALGARGGQTTFYFTVQAEGLTDAKAIAEKRMRKEGYSYPHIDKVTELGPSKAPSPAETPRPKDPGTVVQGGGRF
jgi:hypothetical protein